MKEKEYILVVGGAGYIGSHTNKMLHNRGYNTIVLDNLSTGIRDAVKWGTFIEGDMGDKFCLHGIFSRYNIKAVMHFSAFAYVGESVDYPSKYYINNVTNTLNLLDVMRAHNIKHFIFSSTCATFGEPTELPVHENLPQNPISPYGRTKLMVEQILKDYETAYGMRHITLRYFNAAGADPEGDIGERHSPETHLIPLVLYTAAGRRSNIKIFGDDYLTMDGTCIRDYIHVNDLADAHIRALQWLAENDTSDHFNLGNGKGFSVKQIIKTAEHVTGCRIPIEIVERRPGDPAVIVGSSAKAANVLGWKPKFNRLDTIIETAWNWHMRPKQLPQNAA